MGEGTGFIWGGRDGEDEGFVVVGEGTKGGKDGVGLELLLRRNQRVRRKEGKANTPPRSILLFPPASSTCPPPSPPLP
jgi:hypothetical protein